MLQEYKIHVEERASLGIPPLPLNAEQAASVVELLKMTTTEWLSVMVFFACIM